MTSDLQKNKLISGMESAFIYFLLLQPILDVLAYFDIPVSIVIRVLAMGAGFIYTLLLPDKKGKKTVLIYFLILGLFMGINLINNYIVKYQFIITSELTYIIKTVFFMELLIVYLFVIRSFSAKENWQKIIQQCVFINMAFISGVMLLASLTDTAKRSYGSLAKEGHTGWFFSANELSIILGMGFSMMILYMVQKKSQVTKVQLLPFIGLTIWAMLTVGTKVSFGSIIIVLTAAILILIIKRSWVNFTTLAAMLAATIFITPSTPVGNNLHLTFGLDITNQQNVTPDTETTPEEQMQIDQKILSGRSDFLKNIMKQYKEAPISQKLFGMGHGGNYTNSPKLIEMDFLDWYFSFGVIGFVLLMLPLIYIGYRILINLFKYHIRKISVPIIFTGLSVCLGLGSAFVAGHVLSSPASGIYLAIFIGYLFVLTKHRTS
ncbi:O-antigen ligase family protein [Virgibacillus doumboii]|uniref:O-antigen ligase family protein n=1 Tax=Virgibacillus doumboii TaxID=2697503 RepID=UPI0013DF4BB2|nr:O-antigen ligase family protein [Virgibacillus doumboii]